MFLELSHEGNVLAVVVVVMVEINAADGLASVASVQFYILSTKAAISSCFFLDIQVGDNGTGKSHVG